MLDNSIHGQLRAPTIVPYPRMELDQEESRESLIVAEFNVAYWTELGQRNYSLTKYTEFGVAVLTSSTVGSLLAYAPSWVPTIISISAAAGSIALVTLGWKKEAAAISVTRGKWSELVQAYQQLWNRVSDGSIYADQLRTELERPGAIKVIADKGEPLIRTDEKLRSRCFDKVLQRRGLLQK